MFTSGLSGLNVSPEFCKDTIGMDEATRQAATVIANTAKGLTVKQYTDAVYLANSIVARELTLLVQPCPQSDEQG